MRREPPLRRNQKAEQKLHHRDHFVGEYHRLQPSDADEGDPFRFKYLDFYIKPAEWYQENNIKLTLGMTVTEIRKDSKEIVLANGETRKYDKLILATGAEAFIPPIKGADQEGVTAIRSLEGVKRLQETLKKISKAGVIGGGILGLEAAWELKKAGKEVTVIELSPNIMNKQLDEKGSALLQDAAEKSGIRVITGKGIEEIAGEGKASGVKLADGTTADGELVILSTGVKPNIELAKAAGIETGRSIKVNERMETSEKDIYACGDCAEYNGVNYAIWGQAWRWARRRPSTPSGTNINTCVWSLPTPSAVWGPACSRWETTQGSGKGVYKSVEIYDGVRTPMKSSIRERQILRRHPHGGCVKIRQADGGL